MTHTPYKKSSVPGCIEDSIGTRIRWSPEKDRAEYWCTVNQEWFAMIAPCHPRYAEISEALSALIGPPSWEDPSPDKLQQIKELLQDKQTDTAMTNEEQFAEVDKWCAELRSIMEYGISKGREGWRNDPALGLIARLHERLARALRDPTPEHAASAAAYVFMAIDKLAIETAQHQNYLKSKQKFESTEQLEAYARGNYRDLVKGPWDR